MEKSSVFRATCTSWNQHATWYTIPPSISNAGPWEEGVRSTKQVPFLLQGEGRIGNSRLGDGTPLSLQSQWLEPRPQVTAPSQDPGVASHPTLARLPAGGQRGRAHKDGFGAPVPEGLNWAWLRG